MSFFGDLKRFANKTNKDLDTVFRSINLGIGNSVTFLSPVDTGRFRQNWRFEIGREDLTIDTAIDKSGTITLGRLRAKIKDVELGDTFYISNNLPYAYRLEHGWSEQRPAEQGIVRETSRLFQKIVKDALKDIGK